MKISIFTPTHDSRWLLPAYESIREQDWQEWIILAQCPVTAIPNFHDDRVRVVAAPSELSGVGALKRYAVSHCTGDVLLEIDHDDLLMPDAVERVRGAFADKSVGFVYSASANFQGDFQPTPRFNLAHGWEYRPMTYQGHSLEAHQPWPPTPASLSRIWYGPNHVRAWRTAVYWQAGGHNPAQSVLDDQDLVCRTYLTGCGFVCLPECLYLYRVHGDNTWLERNAEIQAGTLRLYDQYIEPLALEWARREGLLALDLGGRFGSPPGYISVDRKDAAVIADLSQPWPFEDNSVGVVRAYDVFEHLPNPLHTMTELYRILSPGGYAFIQVPSTDGRGAFQDPTHVSFWNENSLLYYTDSALSKYIDTPVRFQAMKLVTTEPNAINVCWVQAHLVSLKSGYRPPGIITI